MSFPKSQIREHGGQPAIFVDGKVIPGCAYITYLQERGCFSDFSGAGYNLFSVPVYFGGRGINTTSGIAPFERGLFDSSADVCDLASLSGTLDRIFASSPDGYVFLRLNVMLPEWWENEHHDQCNRTDSPYGRRDITYRSGNGKTLRESFFSAVWLDSVKNLLRKFIRCLDESRYAGHIIGIQISDGNTEEWFHFDLNAGISPAALIPYRKWMLENYPGEADTAVIPDGEIYDGENEASLSDRNKIRYLEFANYTVTHAISELSREVKELSGGNLLTGCFYGYSWEVGDPRWGSSGIADLLDNPDIDFFCSPCSYATGRAPGCDWPEMQPCASIRHHGKLVFTECDVRTNLTRPLCECREGADPCNVYHGHVWNGPEDTDTTVGLMRKAFAKQLTAGNALWWFDMWGGWYADDSLMAEISSSRRIMAESLTHSSRRSMADTAVFIQSSSYYEANIKHPVHNTVFGCRRALGECGIVYDCYDICDFEEVFGKYKAIILLISLPTPERINAENILKRENIPFISCTDISGSEIIPMTPDRDTLRRFFERSGVHIWCGAGDIVYAGCGYLALHAASGGTKHISLPFAAAVRDAVNGETITAVSGDGFDVCMGKYETRIFELPE